MTDEKLIVFGVLAVGGLSYRLWKTQSDWRERGFRFAVAGLALLFLAVAVIPLLYLSVWLSIASGLAATILAVWLANKEMEREFRKPESPLRKPPRH